MQLPIQDPILIFAAVMLVILLAPIFFSRLRLPGSVGLILAGVITGPYALNLLERGQIMIMLGAVGLLYLMFLAGLEIDFNQFIRKRNHSLAFGFLTFTLPFGTGVYVGVYLLGMDWPSAMLMASMFASHTLISYPIVSAMGMTKSRSVTTAIGGTLITDTAALLVLAMVAGAARGSLTVFFWVSLFGYLSVYILLMLWALPALARWFFSNVASDGIVEFVFVLASVFFCSWLAHLAGLEPILGAFLAGLAFNRLVPEQSVLMNRLQFIGKAFFIPFFLISVGMLIDLRLVFSSGRMWIFAGTMVVIAVVSKWLAAKGIQRLLKYSPDEGGLVYGLSVNQAAATLAAALVGYELGIIGDEVLTGAVMMILVTCTMGPWITEKYARLVALKEKSLGYDPGTAPQRIVVPLANPETAPTLMDLAFMMRPQHSHEPVYPLTVTADGPDSEARVAAGEQLLEHAVVHAAAAEVPVVPVTRVDTGVVSGVVGALRDLRGTHVVIGWNGEISSRQRVFGSVIDGLARMSQQMIVVSFVRQPLNIVKRVVLVLPPLIERHPGFEPALHTAKVLAKQLGAKIQALAPRDSIEFLRPLIGKIKPSVPAEIEPFIAAVDLLPLLKRRRVAGDLLVILAARRGDIAWQPAFDRLPREAARQLTGMDFLAIYPPELRWRADEGDDEDGRGDFWRCLRGIPASCLRLDLDGMSVAEGLRRMMAPEFEGRAGALEDAVEELIAVSQREPVELTPGIVLLHTHRSDIADSLLFLGVNRKGFDMPEVSLPPVALFVILAARDRPPEHHLRMLSGLARLGHQPGLLDKLVRAGSPDDLAD